VHLSDRSSELARDSAIEFVLTFLLLFGVVTIVRFVFGDSRVSATVPDVHVKLWLVGICVGAFLALLIRSPLGRVSGGHINPAITFAMWRFGVFPGRGVLPYTLAQLLGSFCGVLAARLAWGESVADPRVTYAAIQPAPGFSAMELFAGEAASFGLIVLVVGLLLATPRLAALVPWAVGAMIGLAIALLGTSTGGSVNPARQFGPALLSGHIRFLWIYLVAPFAGAEVAVWTRAIVQRGRGVITHRLSGTLLR
jgi:glycerol uptake facilitator protein/aquaporin Z